MAEMSEDESWWMHSAAGVMRLSKHSETIGVRANNAINDMVRQRLLNRFTSEQAEGNAIYRLTPLGIGITDYYIRQRVLYAASFWRSCRLWRVSSNAQQMPPKRAVMNFTGAP